MTERWLDQDAGPIVRPYTLTGGRTRTAGAPFDLIALVGAVRAPLHDLPPEHVLIMNACRMPVSVAELASETGMPIGVLRVLLDDLRASGMITVRIPATTVALPRESVLRDVLAGLRAL
ncbi:DUF742 domain-containing protein [Streptosporangium sp. NBC_01639]|uniref:DUF742 domain-containing protein n=1 Tax=unclassified Streptosporangium TaxID=2632669 RepID=UPI002DD95F9B|nr:DUF742 domain-containing protein [Streptosporangium sp. NBC_01756]WSC83105.1 DUF742 domain-containing protein [Streptosporangium sp. NBC_01756]WTD58347.1 DUF742 domain-containing protein [Streptosporangium sp. NBC_01639]